MKILFLIAIAFATLLAAICWCAQLSLEREEHTYPSISCQSRGGITWFTTSTHKQDGEWLVNGQPQGDRDALRLETAREFEGRFTRVKYEYGGGYSEYDFALYFDSCTCLGPSSGSQIKRPF